MATYIDIVTGFLESGKTTFIQNILNNGQVSDFNSIVLVICEEGFTDYDQELFVQKNIKSIILESPTELNDDLFKQIDAKFHPDYIIVEYNGTWDISRLLGLKMDPDYRYRNVFFISETGTFRNQLSNMVTLMHPHIQNSNVTVFNRHETVSPDILKKIVQDIKSINPKTKTVFAEAVAPTQALNPYFGKPDNQKNSPLNSLIKLNLFMLMLLCVSVILIFSDFNDYHYIQSITTIFLSILIQALPFILFGAFFSAIIQLFVSSNWIITQISKGTWTSFLIAVSAGFFLPICDCGLVPIVSGLLKKSTPLPQTITFWLASSAVSPIVFLSMLYAFPEQPYLAVIRVITGVVIGIVAGIILKLAHLETSAVIQDSRYFQTIGKDILDLKFEGTKGKIEAVFAGAKSEFFRVSKYVIIGALVSAILQTILPQTLMHLISSNPLLQFMIMVAAAIFMSTCSTSNAFIGKSFSNNFSTIPILAFVVMGPMLDLKNMLMLSGVLKKRFLIVLATLVILEGAVVFSTLAYFL